MEVSRKMVNNSVPKPWYYKIIHMDRRIIYVLLAVVMTVPIVFPFMIPIHISTEVEHVYKRVELLKPGDVVVLSFDFSPSSAAENYPHAEDILRHLAMKDGIRVIAVSFWPQGPMLADQALEIYEGAGKVYGVDYINLGYCAGGEPAIARFAESIEAAFPKDFKGVATNSYPIMQTVQSAQDIDLIVDFSAGSPGPRELIRQIHLEYKKDLIVGAGSAMVPTLMPYYQAGQIYGMLSGLRGAAEYEALINQPGKGAAGISSLTMGHLLIIVFLVLGNVGFFLSKRSRKKGVGADE